MEPVLLHEQGFQRRCPLHMFSADSNLSRIVETQGPLGTLWAGLGLGAFFLALTWVNLLLGHFLTPLFLIPLTWLQDAFAKRKG